MKITSILALAIAPLALAKTLTLYVSTHETGYTVNFPNANSVAGVNLSDEKGALKVLGSLTFDQPGETMIAMNDGKSTAWCTVKLVKDAKVDAANLVLRNGSVRPSVIGDLKSVNKNAKVDSKAVTLDCRFG